MADEDDSPQEIQPELVVGHESEPNEVSYNRRDLILYALGIGCKNTEVELPFVYEDHENFAAFPTFPLVLPFKGTSTDVVPFPSPTLFSFPPGLPSINPSMILHGEQSLELIKALDPQGASLTTKGKIIGLYDKGKGALLREETRYFDTNGDLVSIAIQGSFVRGLTGFTSKGAPLPPQVKCPPGPPVATWEEAISPEQALVYRLSGDYNPLHADPDIATSVGFDKPILHGLCTYGHAARAVLLKFASGNPQALQSITARFSRPAFPGETLVTSMWKGKADGEVVFQCKVKERGVVVLDGGLIVLRSGGSHSRL